MKLIMENWREYLKEEAEVDEAIGDVAKRAKSALRGTPGWEEETRSQSAEAGEDVSPGINTVGDLRKVLALRRSSEFSKDVLSNAFGMTPGIGNVYAALKTAKDTKDLFTKLYGAGDDFETQSGLDALNVDDKISGIVDDKIELAFLRDLINQFKGLPDKHPLEDIKTTELIQKFIADKFGGTTVKK